MYNYFVIGNVKKIGTRRVWVLGREHRYIHNKYIKLDLFA